MNLWSLNFAYYVLLIAGGWACNLGGPEDRVHRDHGKPDLEDSQNDLLLQNCEGHEDPSQLSHLYRNLLRDDGRVQTQKVNLSGVKTTPSLSSSFIVESTYGFHQRSSCKIVAGQLSCDGQIDVIQSPRPLRLCGDLSTLPRFSIEAAALSAIASFELLHRQFISHFAHVAQLSPARLLVFPKLESQVFQQDGQGGERQLSLFDTDNMAFAHSFMGRPTYVIYPRSKQGLGGEGSTELGLWESAWVIGHEFGHQIFRTVTGSGADGQSGRVHDFGPKRRWWSPQGLSLNHSAKVTERVDSVLNEGFSDLYSYYVHEHKSPGLAALNCLRINRDVSSPHFSNQKEKVFDQSAAQAFIEGQRSSTLDCNEPQFSDIHVAGAVMARIIHELIALSTGDVTSGADSSLDAQKRLIQWLQSYQDIRSSGTRPQQLEALLWQAIEPFWNSNDELKIPSERRPNACRVIDTRLPILRNVAGFAEACAG